MNAISCKFANSLCQRHRGPHFGLNSSLILPTVNLLSHRNTTNIQMCNFSCVPRALVQDEQSDQNCLVWSNRVLLNGTVNTESIHFLNFLQNFLQKPESLCAALFHSAGEVPRVNVSELCSILTYSFLLHYKIERMHKTIQ